MFERINRLSTEMRNVWPWKYFLIHHPKSKRTDTPAAMCMLQVFSCLLMLMVAFFLSGCNKGEKRENQPPETLLVPREVNLSGEQSLITRVRLHWFGTDPDGYISGYKVSVNGGPVFFTEKTDSIFLFPIPEGSRYGSAEITVNAVDNSGMEDPTGAYLKIPLKNTDPISSFDEKFSTRDTAIGVVSLFWEANDPDGLDNLKHIELKVNNGPWVAIDRKLREIHIVPVNKLAGISSAKLYKDNTTILTQTLDGLEIGGENTFYLRSVDMAAAQSTTDTLKSIHLFPITGDLLFVSGDVTSHEVYKELIESVYSDFDILDLAKNNGARQPAKWDPGFSLQIAQYDKVVFSTDNKKYNNLATGASNNLLETTARPFLNYFNTGGKLFCISFLSVDTINLSQTSPIFGAFPLESVFYSTTTPRIINGTDILQGTAGYPSLNFGRQSGKILTFNPSSDATIIYRGTLLNNGYAGPDILGAKRGIGGKTSQVFIGAYLYEFYGYDKPGLIQLFDHVINTEFNW